jgi:hypothetical protein
MMRDSAALRVKDVEDRAALAEMVALEKVSRVEVENAVTLASAHEDVEGFVQKITLLEGELAAERRAQEMSKRERREQLEELTLLQTWGFDLCHTIVGPPRVRHHLSEGMQLVALHHTEMVRELAAFWAVVSSTTESTLGCSPNDTFHVEIVGELVATFQKLEEQRSWLERPTVRIYDLLLGLPPNQA